MTKLRQYEQVDSEEEEEEEEAEKVQRRVQSAAGLFQLKISDWRRRVLFALCTFSIHFVRFFSSR